MASSVSEGSGAPDPAGYVPARRPLIGLTTYLQKAAWGVWDTEAAVLPAEYVRMVVEAGGVPVLLPPHGTDAAMLDAVDGLMLTGGADVGPDRYNQSRHSATRDQPWRDDHELFLLGRARQRGIPVLGVCRGLQVINVSCGGTLHQHLPEVLGHTERQPGPGVYGQMRARTTAGSRIAAAVGAELTAPCYHHQAVDQVGQGLEVTAVAEDGTVEALESAPGGPWMLAVQWHPEHNPADMRVVAELVRAAEQHAGSASSGASSHTDP
ncbi:MAG TPA: gamma-glutamyl-gamma-aminobutyrate hydrolase family protein [Candidatus Nesterenkonia stercoripullorum]|uniref:Gamma-glutamyl-gamma-aminobutyrate hydrolase family protein n=1 Tax=Candidatus Nesterenkonia stercoripullorum TaxID=2838701 RepID=A0A9D1S003_9MICC|nr:gamma-glutamyl-gamma-aminobutyrate hydrolase family protein [Candidatus Nesterenkonia stercoripullorum]